MVDVNTGFSEFNDLVKGDHRSDTLDPGNIKMSFNHVSMVTGFRQVHVRSSLSVSNSYCPIRKLESVEIKSRF